MPSHFQPTPVADSGRWAPQPADLVAVAPKTVWIELTSTCPFDCVFCSRKHERGHGQHMSFALYQSLIRQLGHEPELIRLNYSGESTHYPQLREAIQLARGTGATTELVSALATTPTRTLEALVDTGLHRLSVSIHSLNAAEFRQIYGRAEWTDLCDRLLYLREYKKIRQSLYPEIDFAFVAMQENLAQLLPLAEFAQEFGAKHISVHPVIRRSALVPIQFADELDRSGDLRKDFATRVHEQVAIAAERCPGVSIGVARPESPSESSTGNHAITTCEQNPWDTIHVLAHGGVVVCEVQDRTEIGNLNHQTLAEIWHGEVYQAFRRQYLDGRHPTCRPCPWRRTFTPVAKQPVPVRGWHAQGQGEAIQWSEASAVLAVAVPPGVTAVHVTGLLPPHPAYNNALQIHCAPSPPAEVLNNTRDILSFAAAVPIDRRPESTVALLRFETRHRFCPAEQNQGPDLRRLGFALAGITFEVERKRQTAVRRLLALLKQIDRLAKVPPMFRQSVTTAAIQPGVSLVIPARDTPDLLVETLTAATLALSHIPEPSELLIVVSGAEPQTYEALRRGFPNVTWLFAREPLGYGAAIELGVAKAQHPWLYLLNSDMRLHPRSLVEVLKLRRPDTFAIGSRIRMDDGSRTETNWTDLRNHQEDAVELIERDPDNLNEPRGCLYVGGGSGLFQTALLRKMLHHTRAYAPFYWEDVEWGASAWRLGYRCLFCPTSEAVHGHRRTISRYYPESHITRIFERNRLLFHLRNLREIHCLEHRLLSLDAESWTELCHPKTLFDTARARSRAFLAPYTDEILRDRWTLAC